MKPATRRVPRAACPGCRPESRPAPRTKSARSARRGARTNGSPPGRPLSPPPRKTVSPGPGPPPPPPPPPPAAHARQTGIGALVPTTQPPPPAAPPEARRADRKTAADLGNGPHTGELRRRQHALGSIGRELFDSQVRRVPVDTRDNVTL